MQQLVGAHAVGSGRSSSRESWLLGSSGVSRTFETAARPERQVEIAPLLSGSAHHLLLAALITALTTYSS